MPKRTRRSFAACWTCRRRRVACDGIRPHCSPCRKHQVDCEGYDVQLVWVDPETGSYQSHSRRSLDPHVTWAHVDGFGQRELDHLVEWADEGLVCGCRLHSSPDNPFKVFERDLSHSQHLSLPSQFASVQENVSVFPDRPPLESSLFHHYVTYISPLMIPVDTSANPWKSTYPSLALQDSSLLTQSLYHAILSQAAFNLTALHALRPEESQKYLSQALKHYGRALEAFRQGLQQDKVDFSPCVATLLTLVVIEGGFATEDLHEWDQHYHGASTIITQFLRDSPWLASHDAWVISQSLALSFEVTQSGRSTPVGRSPLTDVLLDAVSAVDSFGYTIGACRDTIYAISSVRLLGEDLARDVVPEDLDEKVAQLIATLSVEEEPLTCEDRLSSPAKGNQNDDYLNKLHRRIFRNAVLVYLYRTIFNVIPSVVSEYVTACLNDAIEFVRLSNGGISLWPVFIASVEACTEDQKHMASQWLEYMCSLGMYNRYTARRIIEEVWRERDGEAEVRGVQASEVVVDWKCVQRRLGVNLQLL